MAFQSGASVFAAKTLSLRFEDLEECLSSESLSALYNAGRRLLLERVPELSKIPDSVWPAILSRVQERRVRRWDVVLRRGDPFSSLLVMEQGSCIEAEDEADNILAGGGLGVAASVSPASSESARAPSMRIMIDDQNCIGRHDNRQEEAAAVAGTRPQVREHCIPGTWFCAEGLFERQGPAPGLNSAIPPVGHLSSLYRGPTHGANASRGLYARLALQDSLFGSEYHFAAAADLTWSYSI